MHTHTSRVHTLLLIFAASTSLYSIVAFDAAAKRDINSATANVVLSTASVHLAVASASDFQAELSTPTTVPVLVVNYLAVGTSIVDTQILKGAAASIGYNGPAAIEQTGHLASARLGLSDAGAQRLADFLTEATIYHGYKSDAPQISALNFKIVDTVTILQRKDDPAFSTFNTKNATLGYRYFPNIDGYARGTQTNFNPDYYRDPFPYIFDRAEICKYVAGDPSVFSDPTKASPVRMVFFHNHGQAKLNNTESTGAGAFGFIGNNSEAQPLLCAGGNPLAVSNAASAEAFYNVVSYGPLGSLSFPWPPGTALEDFGHHYEAVFNSVLGNFFYPSPYSLHTGDQRRNPSFTAYSSSQQISLGGYRDFPEFGVRIEMLRLFFQDGYPYADFRVTRLAGAATFPRNFSHLLQGRDHIEPRIGDIFTIRSGQRATLAGEDLTFFPYAIGGNPGVSGETYSIIYRPGDQFGLVRRCGWTHGGPNAEGNYNWGNDYYKVRTDCEDWTPDESGQIISDIDCTRWRTGNNTTCHHDPNESLGYRGLELDAKMYVMQNIPGLNNDINIVRNGRVLKMRNLWAFISDYDNARRRAQDFFFDTGSANIPPPTNLTASYSNNQIILNWTAPTGIANFNIFRKEIFSNGTSSQYHRVNNDPVQGTSFTDGAVLPIIINRRYTYEVRSLQLSPMRLQGESGPVITLISDPSLLTLIVVRNPSNGGTVTGTGSISGSLNSCLNIGTCSNLVLGEVITLNASVSNTYSFVNWDNLAGSVTGCSTSPVCTFIINTNSNVGANFSPTSTLTVTKSGTGSGKVISLATAGISCGTDCTHDYTPGTVVALSATSDTGSKFISWSGCDAPNGRLCTMTMNSDKTVAARFDQTSASATLTLLSPNGGEQWRIGDTKTITWKSTGAVGSTVIINVRKGNSKIGTFTPKGVLLADNSFAVILNQSWLVPSNDYKIVVYDTSNSTIRDESDATFTITAKNNYTYENQVFRIGDTWTFKTAPVTDAQHYLIAFHKAGAPGWFYENYAHDGKWSYDGTWTIAPSHPLYNSFVAGEDVRVEFRPYTSAGWGAQKFVTVKIDGPNPLPTGATVLTTTISGESSLVAPGGKIVSQEMGIDCGSDCSEVYQNPSPGLTVTLYARPNQGYKFTQWVNGGCQVVFGATCHVNVGSSKTMTALFVKDNTIVPSLAASLDPNSPVAKIIAPSSANVEVARFRLTAGAGGDVVVSSLTIQMAASDPSCPYLSNLRLRDSTGIQLGLLAAALDNRCGASFTNSGGASLDYRISAGQTAVVSAYVDVAASAPDGSQFAYQLVGMSAEISATGLPVVGNAMTIGTGVQFSIADVTGYASPYGEGDKVKLTIKGAEFDGTSGTPEEGFNVQVYMKNKTTGDPVWLKMASNGQPDANAVFDGAHWLFVATEGAKPGSYEADIAFYCGRDDAICATRYGPASQVNRKVVFSVVVGSSSQPSITLLSPNGGEVWEVGKTYEVKWSSSGIPSTTSDVIQLDLIPQVPPPELNVEYPSVQVTGNPGKYEWVIPSTLPPASDYRVFISTCAKPVVGSSTCGVGQYPAQDNSDAVFTVVAPPSQLTILQIQTKATQLKDNNFEPILVELNLLRNLIQEQQAEIKYLKALTQDLAIRSSQAEAAIKNFITYGVDENTKKLGAGERAAVMHSYKSAFDKLPETEEELTDAIKIANGRWPSEESASAESRAVAEFKKIYRRDPNLKNPNDDAAVTVMAYGLRQRAENRNLKSEAKGILTFKNLYHRTPSSTEDWNIVQAITYSGARR